MLKKINAKTGQMSAGEYAVLFAIVVATFTTMTVYMKRALQARIHNSRNLMVALAKQQSNGYYDGNFIYEYEPYYLKTTTDTNRMSRQAVSLSGPRTDLNTTDTLSMNTSSETLSPLDYNQTEPKYY